MPAPAHLHVLHGDNTTPLHPTADVARANLAELLRRHDMPLNTRCGQRGLCDGCLVELVAGELRATRDGTRIAAEDLTEPLRACDHRLDPEAGPVTIRIPERSAMSHAPQVLTDFKINVPWANDPLDPHDDRRLAIAIDVGTTTVVVLLVDRLTGKTIARHSDFNRQIHFADDVLSRINLCSSSSDMLGELHRALIDKTLKPLLQRALVDEHASASDVGCITVAGNTTMLHLLAQVDPSPMGFAPFTPAFTRHTTLSPESLGIPDLTAAVHLLPSAAAYVGADITAGVLASRLAYEDGPSLLVDAGTNGEIVLTANGRLLGCATAAGPAFEGAGLTSGMRASSGAISHVYLGRNGQPLDVEVIGEGKPVGLCGSAYLDLLAEGIRHGWLNYKGRIETSAAESLGLTLREMNGYGTAVRIAKGLGNKDVLFAETDIANLLQAKAAIAAGIITLLEQVGMQQCDVQRVYLAGGFGMHMRVDSAIDCGLLRGFEPAQVELVGNTSLAGAYLALVDRGALRDMQRIADRMQLIELNLDPNFEMTYIEQLML